MKTLILFLAAILISLPTANFVYAAKSKTCIYTFHKYHKIKKKQHKHYKRHKPCTSSIYVPGSCHTKRCPNSCRTYRACTSGMYYQCSTVYHYHHGRNSARVEVCR